MDAMRFPLILIGYALVSAYGLYRLKDATEVVSTGFAIGASCYGIGFLVWLGILRLYPLSLAFPAAAGAMILATQLFGIAFLEEQTSWQSICGIVLIAGGIALIYAQLESA